MLTWVPSLTFKIKVSSQIVIQNWTNGWDNRFVLLAACSRHYQSCNTHLQSLTNLWLFFFFYSSADGERPFTVCNCTIKEWKKVYIWPLKNRSDDMDHHRMAWYESLNLCHWNLHSRTLKLLAATHLILLLIFSLLSLLYFWHAAVFTATVWVWTCLWHLFLFITNSCRLCCQAVFQRQSGSGTVTAD